MTTRDDLVEQDVRSCLAAVEDPELPVSIVDLGMVKRVDVEATDGGWDVAVDLVPTFLGCPAQIFIEAAVLKAMRAVDGVVNVHVQWLPAAQWSLEHISPSGRTALKEIGVAVPDGKGGLECPNCESTRIVIDSNFGATLCRRLGHCEECGDPVEIMKSGVDATRLTLPLSAR
jgi:ring-1,2-phenylacetyl-CoA epoxidase subunit PaaD